MKIKVLESTWPVVKESKYVWINKDRIREFCSEIERDNFQIISGATPDWSLEEYLELILIFNTINFSYWAAKGKEKWHTEIKGKFLDGANGVFAALERAINEGYQLFKGKVLANLAKPDLKQILRGNIVIPMLEERVRCLNEAGQVLQEKFGGRYINLIDEANGSAIKLVNLLVDNFPSFNDSSWYKEKRIEFHKRAQLSAKMIHDALIIREQKGFPDLEELTVFADYKLPQLLRDRNVLVYSQGLADKIDSLIEVPAGSREEIEIRANTIWACEFIKRELKPKIPSITAAAIDSFLWLISQKKSSETKPCHRTRTIFY